MDPPTPLVLKKEGENKVKNNAELDYWTHKKTGLLWKKVEVMQSYEVRWYVHEGLAYL